MKPDLELIERRQQCNTRIAIILSVYLRAHPEMRFGQALVNLGIVQVARIKPSGYLKDPFYEEPWITLERVKENYERYCDPQQRPEPMA